jgi:hypothetical protein
MTIPRWDDIELDTAVSLTTPAPRVVVVQAWSHNGEPDH